MSDRVRWTSPTTGMEHVLGQRVLWVDGRRDYAETGLMGTVIAFPEEGDGFTVRLDPMKRKRKSDPEPEPRIVTFTSDHVLPVREAIRRTSERLRRVADDYDRIAAQYDADSIPTEEARS